MQTYVESEKDLSVYSTVNVWQNDGQLRFQSTFPGGLVCKKGDPEKYGSEN